ncbi:hypothetical protein MFLAVUS_003702 [Mucor flavus]|uniref:Uncharacterized protein n=1 Tax=Mucor flavus TaxID=439312 RepID=A0ABP9YTU0_9FUNG
MDYTDEARKTAVKMSLQILTAFIIDDPPLVFGGSPIFTAIPKYTNVWPGKDSTNFINFWNENLTDKKNEAWFRCQIPSDNE